MNTTNNRKTVVFKIFITTATYHLICYVSYRRRDVIDNRDVKTNSFRVFDIRSER